MNNQLERLNGDPLPWLLEPENPSVRYWTLVDILGKSTKDPEVKGVRMAIAQQTLVREIFTMQNSAGHWGSDETSPYTTQGTMGVLSLLHTLGVEPDERTRAGCDSFLCFSQHVDGGFSMVKTRRSGIFPCTTGQHLPFLVYFGFRDDARVQQAFEFLIRGLSVKNALVCSRYQGRECLWGAIAALKGLAILPTELRSPQSENVVDYLGGKLLDAGYDFESAHKRWLTFGVPRAWDLLSALLVLSEHGYASDPRFTRLFERVLGCQNESGRWLCGSTSRAWPLEKRNRPSKWITLDALRLLRITPSIAPRSIRKNRPDESRTAS